MEALEAGRDGDQGRRYDGDLHDHQEGHHGQPSPDSKTMLFISLLPTCSDQTLKTCERASSNERSEDEPETGSVVVGLVVALGSLLCHRGGAFDGIVRL